jgi:Uma2 family endonuclease
MRPAVKPAAATLSDLLALPEEERYELIDGELVPKEAARGEHGTAQTKLAEKVGPYNRRPGGRFPGGWWFATEVLVDLGSGQAYRPDIAGWRRERMPQRPTGVPITVRPDWICEILSPGNASHDTIKKMRGYHRAEVPHYWILDPMQETLEVYRWHQDGYLLVQGAQRSERIRAEPFDAVELQVGVFFGDEEEDE